MNKQSIARSILAAELLLLVPLTAMLFTDEVRWGPEDYIIAGFLLAGAGFAWQMIVSGVKNNSRQVILGMVLVVLVLLTWAELAVGIFGSPIAGS